MNPDENTVFENLVFVKNNQTNLKHMAWRFKIEISGPMYFMLALLIMVLLIEKSLGCKWLKKLADHAGIAGNIFCGGGDKRLRVCTVRQKQIYYQGPDEL